MRLLNRQQEHEAGLAVAARLAFEKSADPTLRGQAVAILASLRATTENLHLIGPGVGARRECTFLFVRETDDGPRKVALLPGAFGTYDEALRYWIVNGANLLLPGMLPDPWPDDVRSFVQRRTAFVWPKDPSWVLRWAKAAYEYGPGRRDARKDMLAHMALAELSEGKPVPVDEVEHAMGRIWFEATTVEPYLGKIGAKCLLRRTPLLIPINVFAHRGEIPPMQALTWYLVQDPLGPKLTHEEAATILGLGSSSQISTHLKRIRKTTDGTGLPPVEPDSTLPIAPPSGMVAFDVTLRGEPATIPRLGRR